MATADVASPCLEYDSGHSFSAALDTPRPLAATVVLATALALLMTKIQGWTLMWPGPLPTLPKASSRGADTPRSPSTPCSAEGRLGRCWDGQHRAELRRALPAPWLPDRGLLGRLNSGFACGWNLFHLI